MKKLTLTVIALVAMTYVALAGENYTSVRHMATTPDYYRAGETQLDLFGNYSATYSRYKSDRYLKQDHAFGGGIGINRFFTRNLGVGLDGSYINTHAKNGQVTGDVIFRIPCQQFAPYAFIGAGSMFGRHDTKAVGKAGLGIEYRVNPSFGIKTDYSYNMVDGSHNNFGMARTGISLNF